MVNFQKSQKSIKISCNSSGPDNWHLCLVIQSCLTLCNLMDCNPPGTSICGDSAGKNTGLGYHALLQGIYPILTLNPGLLHCRWILYCLSHRGSPYQIRTVLQHLALPLCRIDHSFNQFNYLYSTYFIIRLYFFFVTPPGLRDFSSLTRN